MEENRLTLALIWIADCLSDSKEPWWIFGGAAFAISKSMSISVPDIDVLVSDRDCQALSTKFGWENEADGGNDKFQSNCFLKTSFQELPIEFMSGLKVKSGKHWRSVEPQTRHSKKLASAQIFLPEPRELASLFELFGRPKDLERAEQLRLFLG